MEYTKDIVLNIEYDKKGREKNKKYLKKILNIYRENKFIVSILSVLTILIIFDFILVNNFVNLIVTL